MAVFFVTSHYKNPSMHKSQPIGIFDSGVGGLTVANAIRQLLPNEELVYFGDTAHLPYGDKSGESIRFYSEKISEFLLEKNAKVIVIACNTASAFGFEHVKMRFGNQAQIINVIDPVINALDTLPEVTKVGIIGTKGTINSNTYPLKISENHPRLQVVSVATPLLAPMIEEGFIFDDISNAIIRAYLNHPSLDQIDTLILGCTHYPIIKNQIRKFYNFQVKVIDSAQLVAQELKNYLLSNQLLNNTAHPNHQFFVSDYTEMFENIAEMFFEEKIILQQNNIWK
jgi:glutamate racemase